MRGGAEDEVGTGIDLRGGPGRGDLEEAAISTQ